MEKFVQALVDSMEKEIDNLELQKLSIIKNSKNAFEICEKFKEKLRIELLAYEFENDQEEILFFKEHKIKITGISIYYCTLFKIESACRNISEEQKLTRYKSEMSKIQSFFKKNRDYYNYFKSENSLLDQYYFKRKIGDIHHIQKFENVDHYFSTGYDLYFNKIYAYELIYDYLELKVNSIHQIYQEPINFNFPSVNWTAKQIDLIELMYALYAARSFNHGVIEISVLAAFFEQVFNVKFGNYYRSYIDLKFRNDRTRYLDKLTLALIDKMNKDL